MISYPCAYRPPSPNGILQLCIKIREEGLVWKISVSDNSLASTIPYIRVKVRARARVRAGFRLGWGLEANCWV